MAPEIMLRPYEDGDETGILELLNIVFDGWPHLQLDSSSLDHWKWKFQGTKSISLAISDSKIIGSFHSIPLEVKIGDNIVQGCHGVDIATHPDYRGLGVYNILKDHCYDLRISNGILMHYGITGNPILVDKRKREEMANSKTFPTFPHQLIELVKIKNIDLHLSKTQSDNIILKKIGYNVMKQIYGHKKKELQKTMVDYKIIKIENFDERFDIFWDEIQDYYKFAIARNSGFLNWRYSDIRGGDFITYAAVCEGKILGYIVNNISSKNNEYYVGNIADFIFHPDFDYIGYALLDESMKLFDSNNVNIIYAYSFKGHKHERLFNSVGLVPSTIEPYLQITIFADLINQVTNLQKSNVDEVIFTRGDLDMV